MLQPARTNDAWSADLRSGGSIRESALADLRAIIVKRLPYALGSHLPAGHPEFESLVDEVAQATLLRVLDRLDTFEGRSQFTTWVYKIAIHIAFSDLRRRRWKDVSLDASMENEDTPSMSEPADPSANPEIQAERNNLMMRLDQLLKEELTDKQRMALQAVAMQ